MMPSQLLPRLEKCSQTILDAYRNPELNDADTEILDGLNSTALAYSVILSAGREFSGTVSQKIESFCVMIEHELPTLTDRKTMARKINELRFYGRWFAW